MRFSIPPDHPCLPGHFPGRPVVPGVVLLERVLEAVESSGAVTGALRLPQVKFLRPLLPGREARVLLDGAAPRWRFEVADEDGVLARGELQVEAAADG